MRCVVQRVSQATVSVDGNVVGSIARGLCVLVGITESDTLEQCTWMADKLVALRIFPDEDGKMNRSVVDCAGGVLLISQFTLYGELQKGTRPSFVRAARPEHAQPLFDSLVELVRERSLKQAHPFPVATGVFGAMMDVALVNEGPVTIILER